MMFSTPAELLVLALVLVGGWLLGLASHPGGRKWKARYLAERDAHAAYRRDADTRASDADARAADADRRHAELEREHARLASAAPVTAATVQSPRAAPVAEPVVHSSRVTPVTRPAYASGERRGWFDWGSRRPLDR